jgi:neutral ceramidase
MVRRLLRRCSLVAALSFFAAAAHAGDYEIGSGVYDITGPVAETGMFGYAAQQTADGLHMRLRARAFIVSDPASGRRIAYVNTDLGAMFQSVKLEVVKRLQAKYGALYGHENVMLAATHTHSGNAGLSHYALYQLASADNSLFGYSSQAFNAVVSGIVAAIDRAHQNLAPGTIDLTSGELATATRNRSLAGYQANSDAGHYAHDTDKTMLQLRFRKDNGREIGLLNWYAIHPTALSMKQTKISSDSKGYAELFFERSKGADYGASETFVAAFSNSNEGDVVSSHGNAYSAPGYQGSSDEYANVEVDGSRQLQMAQALYQQAGQRLSGRIDYRHQWTGMSGFVVRPEFSKASAVTLCTPSRGYAFAAGGENGPSNIPGISEGMTHDNTNIGSAFQAFLNGSPTAGAVLFAFGVLALPFDDPCQWAKPTLLATGALDWVPKVLPHQVFVVGPLAIVGLPYEATTMSGRRIRAQVMKQLAGSGVTTVVIAGLANSYSGYLTTPEEYATQQYEGASTEFGPFAEPAVEQIVSDLASALAQGRGVADTGTPPDKSRQAFAERPGVVFDDKPLFQQFGQVLVQPAASYARGGKVVATFRGGHPKNNLRTQDTFLKVERWNGSSWQTVANDWDFETTYTWRREGIAYSQVDVEWRIPPDAATGTYRLRQFGNWKNGWTGAVSSYAGTTRSFEVR